MRSREAIANKIIEELSSWPVTERVWLRGSLSDGKIDEYSDIDIGLLGKRIRDREICDQVVSFMDSQFAVEFYDWAKSLLPEKCVITFFLKDLPIHWNIDFEIAVPVENRTLSRDDVEYDELEHDLKIWVLASKYLIRGTDEHKDQINRFVMRVLTNFLY